MECSKCKLDGNCESKARALWTYGEGRDILGCNMGKLDKAKIISKMEILLELLKENET